MRIKQYEKDRQKAQEWAEQCWPIDGELSRRVHHELMRQAFMQGYEHRLKVSDRSKPSLMVGFSEEEIQRIVTDSIPPSAHVGLALTPEGALAMARTFMEVGLRHANTRAVSIDKIMEVVEGWSAYSKVTENDPEGFGDLRKRLENMEPSDPDQ